MRRVLMLLLALALSAGLLVSPGCRQQMVTVQSGEIVICTYGEIVSDTTEEIEVPANAVAEHGVTTTVVTCDLHQKLEALYSSAERALAEGDLEAAERAFAEIAATDPSYRDTATQLADLRAGSSGGSGSSSNGSGSTAAPGSGDTGSAGGSGTTPGTTPGTGGSGTTPGGPGDSDLPVGPIANLTTYIPDRLPGFVGQRIYADPFVLFRDYLPESSGPILQLAVEVEQFKDAAMARSNLDNRARVRYYENNQDLKIGSLDGYFGTRQGFAGLAMTDGAIFILLEVATSASNPATHKDALVAAARVMTGQ